MQGGKNWILLKDINANRFFRDFHGLEIWKNPNLSLYGTDWRERGYGLGCDCMGTNRRFLPIKILQTICDSGLWSRLVNDGTSRNSFPAGRISVI
jgi:hypothetical protein